MADEHGTSLTRARTRTRTTRARWHTTEKSEEEERESIASHRIAFDHAQLPVPLVRNSHVRGMCSQSSCVMLISAILVLHIRKALLVAAAAAAAAVGAPELEDAAMWKRLMAGACSRAGSYTHLPCSCILSERGKARVRGCSSNEVAARGEGRLLSDCSSDCISCGSPADSSPFDLCSSSCACCICICCCCCCCCSSSHAACCDSASVCRCSCRMLRSCRRVGRLNVMRPLIMSPGARTASSRYRETASISGRWPSAADELVIALEWRA